MARLSVRLKSGRPLVSHSCSRLSQSMSSGFRAAPNLSMFQSNT
ncbi:hypothetical protein A6R68_08412 [Neotoma lepida]|uniref:Uncharacterized protein n=1 Tax=Neotoma lepida TaxID=56216 RepID=A0A1A6G3P1_NEOLE|nr:hypothetical protein A6R68_08412 [Neotoma lepida]